MVSPSVVPWALGYVLATLAGACLLWALGMRPFGDLVAYMVPALGGFFAGWWARAMADG